MRCNSPGIYAYMGQLHRLVPENKLTMHPSLFKTRRTTFLPRSDKILSKTSLALGYFDASLAARSGSGTETNKPLFSRRFPSMVRSAITK